MVTRTAPGSVSRARIVAEALTWIGTPYADLQGLKGPGGGVDCVYLLLGVAQAVGALPATYPRPVYSSQAHLHTDREHYREALEAVGCQEIPWDARQPGDIVLFRFGRVASHAAILVTPSEIVHAHSRRGVLRHPVPGSWWARLVAVYTFPRVDES